MEESVRRNLAATRSSRARFAQAACQAQANLESSVLQTMQPFVDQARPRGVLLSGGAFLNTFLNTAIYLHFGLPTHVAPSPSDLGLSIGAVWLHRPPVRRQTGVFWQGEEPRNLAMFRANMSSNAEARNTSSQTLANLLSKGKIVGIMMG
uniref:Carbamoyltransferase domain-containing protein n=1 Tax=Eutreptiella gymnastica TaxID=73025 RepID=A0A7S1N6S4_9EUGL